MYINSTQLLLILTALLAIVLPLDAAGAEGSKLGPLSQQEASHFAELVLKSVHREYPNKLDHVVNSASDVRGPQALHPAFYGCFDWHSSVHGHWLLVRLLRMVPLLPEASRIREVLNADLTPDNIRVETSYFSAPGRQSYERTYGWAWLLKLDEELYFLSDTDADARRWREALQPLTNNIVARYLDFLPRQNYPIRTGVHPNTAFGMALAFDYAHTTKNAALVSLISARARDYFLRDRNYPADWEPGGEDFLSPALAEADLMRRVLNVTEFRRWFHKFLPSLATDDSPLLVPAKVLDRTDPKLVHLDGLNLSRAWCMNSIALALSEADPIRKRLINSAAKHSEAGLPFVASGDYVGEHWLATFAVYLQTDQHAPHDHKAGN